MMLQEALYALGVREDALSREENSIWLFTDFEEENGATRIVPGTHRSGKHPSDEMEDAKAAHPNEIKLIGTSGTVVVFNSHLWHGLTLNQSNHDRPNVTSFWCRRHASAPGQILLGLGVSR